MKGFTTDPKLDKFGMRGSNTCGVHSVSVRVCAGILMIFVRICVCVEVCVCMYVCLSAQHIVDTNLYISVLKLCAFG